MKIIFTILIAGSLASCNLFLTDSNTSSTTSFNSTAFLFKKAIAYFPFDEDTNDAAGHDLIAKNFGSTLTPAFKNNGAYFDGIDDYIEVINTQVPLNFLSKDAYSISFWVKPDAIQNDVDVHENDLLTKWVIDDQDTSHLQTGYPFCLRILNQSKGVEAGKFYVANFSGQLKDCDQSVKTMSPKKLSFTDFSYVVFVQTPKEMTLYLNGEKVSSTPMQAMCSTKNQANLRIGKRGGLKYQNHFAGIVDELFFYGGELSAEEVKRLFENY